MALLSFISVMEGMSSSNVRSRSVPLSLDGVNYTEQRQMVSITQGRRRDLWSARGGIPKNLLLLPDSLLTNACNDVAVAEDALVPEFPVPCWLGTLKRLRDSLLVDALLVCHFSTSKEDFMSCLCFSLYTFV